MDISTQLAHITRTPNMKPKGDKVTLKHSMFVARIVGIYGKMGHGEETCWSKDRSE